MTTIEKKVLALNELNKYCDIIYKMEHNYFKNLVGQCVQKQDNSLLKKHKRDLIDIKEQKDGYYLTVQAFYDSSKYSLDVKVRICINGGSYEDRTNFCIYQDSIVNIDTIDKGLLKGCTYHQYTAPYILADIIKESEKAKIIAEQYKEQLNKIPYELRSVLNLKELK